MIDAETMLDRIAAADSLTDLEAVRVSALGKSGSITVLLKSLGGMDAATRAVEGPKIHALREQVTGAIADRKAALTQAFERTMHDSDFLAEAEKMSMEVNPLDGEAVHKLVAEIYATPRSIVERAAQAIAK